MDDILKKYLPKNAVNPCINLIKKHKIRVVIVNERASKRGDYITLPNKQHRITINATLNIYAFLITLIHEIAHAVTYEKYAHETIKPHGPEWKNCFITLMTPFINTTYFPPEFIPILSNHFKNPKASSVTDTELISILKKYDPITNKPTVSDIPFDSTFKFQNRYRFKKISKKIKRYVCLNLDNGKKYLFSPHTEVDPI